MTNDKAKITSLWRHPIKGFSPERLEATYLEAGKHFPNDRMFAVEDGPSGFAPDAPAHISKMRFTVLARSARVANLETIYLDEEQRLEIHERDEKCICGFDMSSQDGLDELGEWLETRLGEDFKGPLRVIRAPEQHRFMDHHTAGFVSLINENSVSDFGEVVGHQVDYKRFRGNIVFSGNAWTEDNWAIGQKLQIGETELEVIKPIVRCKATHANPETAEYDLDIVPLLMKKFKRNTMGTYAKFTKSGRVSVNDELVVL
ncbi:MOSC domain-containing protein [Hirschia maritima]|uniref:MOSC domain-containing protein n=1 Tax=Hirschia maritima TaxID=1121961 RepID=UPI000369E41C|nr:MOSC domain-containing protein [Hirschia maritima]